MQLTEPQVNVVVSAAHVAPGGGAEAQLLAFEVAQLLVHRQPGDRRDRDDALASRGAVAPGISNAAAAGARSAPGFGCSVSQ